MAKWTPEAERRLAEYLDRVAQLSRDQGDDADEIVDGLRSHITTEVEGQSGEVVTLEHLGRTLAALGTPEQVTGLDGAGSRESLTTGKAAIKPKDATQALVTVKEYSDSRNIRGLIQLSAVALPLFSLFFELATGTMAQMYLDPIPTWAHFVALLLIPVSLVVADRFLTRKEPAGRRLITFVCVLNGYATALSAIYVIVYLPMLPISVICILGMGLGLMGFSPLFCALAGLYQMRALYRNVRATGIKRPWAIKRTIAGAATVLLLSAVAQGPILFRQHIMRMAVSDDPAIRARGMKWIRTLNSEEEVLKACYRPVSRGLWLFRRWDESDIIDWHAYPRLYFRLTGKPYNSVPKPQLGGVMVRRGSLDMWDSDRMADSEIGGAAVAGRVKNLSLRSSQLDLSLASAPDGSAGPALAYIEWTMVFSNMSRVQREARAQIALPHGAVASRLTLWIDDEEREAAFGSRRQVREAYQEVAVVRRRDPALLSTVGPDRLLLQCFPVPSADTLKVKVGITAPLIIRDGTAYLRLPYFSERNFTIPRDFEHNVWAECKVAFVSGSGKLTAEHPSDELFAVRGKLAEQELQDPSLAVIMLPAPRVRGDTYRATLGAMVATMTLNRAEASSDEPGAVCIVVDGSACMARARIDWHQVANALPQAMESNAVFAGNQVDTWRKTFTQSSDDLAAWLSGKEYQGGCDPVPAIEEAWELASAKPGGVILWIHGPLPVELSSTEGLEQWLHRRPASANGEPVQLLSVSVLPGPHRVEEKLGEMSSLEQIPVTGSVQQTLAYVAHNLRAEDVRRDYTLSLKEEALPEEGADTATTSSHLVRLAVLAKVRTIYRTQDKAELVQAAELAARARLVTPVSGAVVLERQEQYERHDLNPEAAKEAIPGIPEPEEWALIIIAICAMLLLVWKRRSAMRRSAAGF